MKTFKKILLTSFLLMLSLVLFACEETDDGNGNGNGDDIIYPIISGAVDREVIVRSDFDLRAGVTASWNEEDITDSIVINGIFNINEVGDYEIEYYVESELGHSASVAVTIKVLPEPEVDIFSIIEEDKTTLHNVSHIKASGNVLNDEDVETYQEVNVFTQGEGVKVASWSKFNSNGTYTTSHTLDIAKDFESKNPNYEVIAAVNGDFFWTETISANVIFGNRVIKPENNWQGYYSSINFNENGNYIENLKKTSFSQNHHLALYNDLGSLEFYDGEGSYLNRTTINDKETTILINNANHVYDSSATYFKLSKINLHQVGAHTYFEASILEQTNSISASDLLIATKNSDLINKLSANKTVIFQNVVNEINYGEMLMGIDNPIIENNIVKEFEELQTETSEQISRNKGRHPRTGFGFNEDGQMVLITVDGRGTSRGVDLREFASIMNHFGVKNGYNLDGGGSTQAVFRADGELQYVNTPSEDNRRVGNALLFIREKEVKPTFNFTKTDSKITFELLDKTNISEIAIILNGNMETYTNFDNKIEISLPEKAFNAVSILYKTTGTNFKLLHNDVAKKFIVAPSDTIMINSNEFDAVVDYDFNANIGTTRKAVVFNQERWQEISAIVDDELYDAKNSLYRISNNVVVVTDEDGNIEIIRTYWKWTSSASGYQFSKGEDGKLKAEFNKFGRDNIEIGLNDYLPENGYVIVFPLVTGTTTENSYTVAVNFALENLFGLYWDLFQGLVLDPTEPVTFEDWANIPNDPFSEDIKIYFPILGIDKPSKIGTISNNEFDYKENFDFNKTINDENIVYRFTKPYLNSLNGFWTASNEDGLNGKYEIKQAFIAVTDKDGNILMIRLANEVQWTASEITWDGTSLVEDEWAYASEYMQTSYRDDHELDLIAVRDLMPEDGYLFVFPNSGVSGNPRTFAFKNLINPNAKDDASFPGVSYMTINPFSEGIKIVTD